MFDRPQSGERAILVHLDLRQESAREDLDEFQELAVAAGVYPVAVITGTRQQPEPRYFVGRGKAADIRERVISEQAEVVLINHTISPGQERNLEQLLECRVVDRTGLILDIFAQRARSHEGKLQVELAQLRHLSSRLIRGWTHLERQKGGIGLRGPGETQLESDRRMIGLRIKQISHKLERTRHQREQSRKSRRRADLPTISLIGYTNVGKSTLFNSLTTASVYAADQLFATLDPTLRRIELPHGAAVLADTVGFIRHLPHDLVEAFRSTLQESREADLILHVIDFGDEERDSKIEQVHRVLKEIGANEVPQLLIFNKIDTVSGFAPRLERNEKGEITAVYLSAHSGAGIELLIEALSERFSRDVRYYRLRLPAAEAKLRAYLHRFGSVEKERINSRGEWLLNVWIRQQNLEILRKHQEFAPLLPHP